MGTAFLFVDSNFIRERDFHLFPKALFVNSSVNCICRGVISEVGPRYFVIAALYWNTPASEVGAISLFRKLVWSALAAQRTDGLNVFIR